MHNLIVFYHHDLIDDKGDELTVKDKDDYRGERRFTDDEIRYVATKLGIQVDYTFGGRSYDYNYYEDLIPVFDNIGIELDHDDLLVETFFMVYEKHKIIIFRIIITNRMFNNLSLKHSKS